jgi:hypothetical protein
MNNSTLIGSSRGVVIKSNLKRVITDFMSLVGKDDDLQGRDNEFND